MRGAARSRLPAAKLLKDQPTASEDELVEKVARAIGAVPVMCGTYTTEGEDAHNLARAALSAIREAGYAVVPKEPDDDWLEAVSAQVHDARHSRSGENYPVLRSTIRAIAAAGKET